jgi:hypothetical protein
VVDAIGDVTLGERTCNEIKGTGDLGVLIVSDVCVVSVFDVGIRPNGVLEGDITGCVDIAADMNGVGLLSVET